MKSPLAKFLDNLFTAAAVWLFSAIIALYFLDKLYLVIVFATVVTMGVSLLLNLRHKKTLELQKEKHNATLMSEYFLFRDDRYALEYFYDALKARYEVTKHEFYLKINNTLIVPCLTEPLPLKKAVFYYSQALRLKAETLVLLTSKTEKYPVSLKEKLTDIRFEIFDSLKTYRLLKSLDKAPCTDKPVKKQKLKGFMITALSPARAKGYLFSAFALLFGAYFTTMSLYFIITAAICLTLVILCKFNVAEKLKKKA